jgi:hypothetical protein
MTNTMQSPETPERLSEHCLTSGKLVKALNTEVTRIAQLQLQMDTIPGAFQMFSD